MTIGELRWLLGVHGAPCISVFMPVHRKGMGAEQDPARLRNLLREAERLLADGVPAGDACELLEPVQRFANEGSWRGQPGGLALFRARDLFATYALPMPVRELAVVSRTFHTRPLVTFLNRNRHFFLLAVAKGGIALFEGTPHGLVKLDVDGLPEPLRASLHDERGRAYLGVHGDMGPGRAPTYHGHANGGGKDELFAYFRHVDRAIWSLLRDELAPVVLAGVPEHHGLYRAASRYPELLDDGIEGNVERMEEREIHARAMEIIRDHEAQVEGELQARIAGELALGRAACELEEVARAAVQGRVRALAHAEGVHLWGYLDRTTGEVQVHDMQRDAEDADVLDDVAEVVLLKGGDVYEIPLERMPGRCSVAALYRY